MRKCRWLNSLYFSCFSFFSLNLTFCFLYYRRKGGSSFNSVWDRWFCYLPTACGASWQRKSPVWDISYSGVNSFSQWRSKRPSAVYSVQVANTVFSQSYLYVGLCINYEVNFQINQFLKQFPAFILLGRTRVLMLSGFYWLIFMEISSRIRAGPCLWLHIEKCFWKWGWEEAIRDSPHPWLQEWAMTRGVWKCF